MNFLEAIILLVIDFYLTYYLFAAGLPIPAVVVSILFLILIVVMIRRDVKK